MATPTSPAPGAAPLQTQGETPHHAAYRPGATATALAIVAACLVAASNTIETVLIVPASRQYVDANENGSTTFTPDFTIGYQFVSLLTLGLLLVTYVVTSVWLWRARGNAEYLAPDAPHTLNRGWVWGSWVVPVIFLWFPYQVVRDVAGATRDDTGGREGPERPGRPGRPSRRLVGLWWGAWVAYLLTTQVVSRIMPWDGNPTSSAARTLVWLEVLDAAVCLVALVLWIRLLLGIHHSQDRAAALLHPAAAYEVPAGTGRVHAGAVWALVLIPACALAFFALVGAGVALGVYEGVTDPDITTAVHNDTAPGSHAVGIGELEKGDCISHRVDEGPMPASVGVVECDTRHVHEVFAVFDLPPGPYPGEKAVATMAEKRCTAQFRDYVGIGYRRSELEFMYMYPVDRAGWATDRGATCMIVGPPTNSSYEGSRQ